MTISLTRDEAVALEQQLSISSDPRLEPIRRRLERTLKRSESIANLSAEAQSVQASTD